MKILKILQHGLKIFLFWTALFFLLRVSYLLQLREFLAEVSTQEILTALIFGTRLSFQTAGILTLIILFASVEKIFCKIVLAILIFATLILHFAAVPFYEQFHSNFNQQIFAGLHDDFFALLVTFAEGFQLLPRLFAVIIFSVIFYQIFHKINFKLNKFIAVPIAVILIPLCFYGGGFTWQTELNFENIGVTKNNLLNESILDSWQAIYRAKIQQDRILNSQGLNFTVAQIKNLSAKVTGKNLNSDNLDDYLKKNAQGAKIQKPKQIFIIISESLANWAIEEQYSDLHMADGLKKLIANGAYCKNFLPNGGNTVSAVTGIVTGFADANLYLTMIPQSYAEIFPTSAAPQMQNLGYKTNFYYAGSATWEKIFDFTTAQGFENFFGEGDIKNKISNASGNVWGVDDKFLYQFILENIDLQENNFCVILNTSNHAPYTVDLAAENIFDAETKIGHYKYAERELCKFVAEMQSREPESLFIILGDHADRFNIETNPELRERYCVPLIIFGCGVEKNFLPENCAGSQIDILPTLIEFIAPRGFEYFSVGRSLTENFIGVNYALYITQTDIGNANVQQNSADLDDYINFVRGVSYWRVANGKILQEK